MTSEGRGLKLLIPPRLRGLVPISWTAGFTWSPDGKQIAFGTWELQFWADPVPGVPRPLLEKSTPRVPLTLSVLDIDAEDLRKLTQVPPVGEKRAPVPQISRPAWSPNGDWIVYSISDVGKRWEPSADIHIMNVRDTDGVGTPLIRGARFYLSPVWVPEGFHSVSPSAGKQTTLWGRLKQMEDASK